VDLKEWAVATGVSYAPARRRHESGTLPVPVYRLLRLVMVGEPLTGAVAGSGQVVVYARVSSAGGELRLDRRVARVAVWVTGQKRAVNQVVTEVGLTLDGHRQKFLGLLRDLAVSTVVVEHRDRFARFGAECIEAVLTVRGRRLLVVDPAGVYDDLVRGVTEILTSVCARLYGRRARADRARRAVEAATGGDRT
jgi:predicted site-specific integrase-resolvase